LEAAAVEGDPQIRIERRPTGAELLELGTCLGDALRIELEAEDLGIRAYARQPRRQLEGGDPARPVAEIDDERISGPAEGRGRGDPAVVAAEAIRARGAARRPAERR